MKPILHIAIDPGLNGATAVRYLDGSVVAFPFVSDDEFRRNMEELQAYAVAEKCAAVVTLEKVGGFVAGKTHPGSAMFNFGDNYGFIRGVCVALGFAVRLVRPQEWQKGLPATPKLADRAAAQRQHKRDLRDTAARLFPSIRVTLKNADALLILDYAITHS